MTCVNLEFKIENMYINKGTKYTRYEWHIHLNLQEE